jgi:hypothetical protein
MPTSPSSPTYFIVVHQLREDTAPHPSLPARNVFDSLSTPTRVAELAIFLQAARMYNDDKMMIRQFV